LFDGDGHGAAASIVSTTAGTVRVERLLTPEAVPSLRLTLAQCISASDKMDWTIEKAVELGVTALVPLQSEKAIVRLTAARSARRHEHWQRLIVAACSQSGRKRVPRLEAVTPLADWLRGPASGSAAGSDAASASGSDAASASAFDASFASASESASASASEGLERKPLEGVLRIVLVPGAPHSLTDILAARETADAGRTAEGVRTPTEVWVLCGPESGLSPAETLQACDSGWLAAGLGPRVLRTETAGLVALAVLQARWGDLR
jgi:16S rRNA (uracil1498-N3)-methyltransferase